MTNQTMIQYFEWNLPSDGLLWRRAAAQAKSLRAAGFDIIWLPPPTKGAAGPHDVGYGVYDTWDLGEFDQKGGVGTKYGTRAEYLACVKALQAAGFSVLADIVLNQRIGADATEQVQAEKFDPQNRWHQISGEETITAWTKYTFPGRAGKYDGFTWDWTCFTGIDWDAERRESGVYRFAGKAWSHEVDGELGNFDYLMGADVDVNNEAVAAQLLAWGRWFAKTSGVNGFRLDALKHIDYGFFEKWLDGVRAEAGRDLFTVGEYWSGDVNELTGYLANSGERMSLFDVPLHMRLRDAGAAGGHYGMQKLFENTLVDADPLRAVTFVDNHDSQPGQALESWVEDWFKPLAYAAILLRRDGLPCVFYGDYYGLGGSATPAVPGLRRMLAARRACAYGEQHDYFDQDNLVGWTREGDGEHENSGLAVLMSDGPGGEKQMFAGKAHAGQLYRDIISRSASTVAVGEDGNGTFSAPGGGVSVWLPQAAYEDIAVQCE